MNAKKFYLSADAYVRDAWRLAAQIRKSGWKPDFLVGLWRGGAPAAVVIHEFLKVSGWETRHLPLKCASYTGIGQNAGEVIFTFGEEIFGLFRPGDKVLFIDDVFDTGKTAAAVQGEISKAKGVEMRFASIYWKVEKNTTTLKPDYYTAELGSEWIVFPHEIEGLTADEIREKDPLLAELL